MEDTVRIPVHGTPQSQFSQAAGRPLEPLAYSVALLKCCALAFIFITQQYRSFLRPLCVELTSPLKKSPVLT